MALNWRRGDTEAFNAVTSAGEKLRAQYDEYLAGQAYKEATQQQERGGLGTQNQVDAARGQADSLSAQDAQTFGLTPEEQASGKYDQQAATQVPTQYGLGKNATTFRDTPYTAQEKRLAGVQALSDHYAGRGDTRNSLLYAAQGDQMQANEQQRKLGALQIDAAGRQATKENLELDRERVRDSTIKEFEEARAAAMKGDYGPLQKLTGRQYNNQLPGLDDGHTIHFLEGGGIAKYDAKTGQGFTAPLNEKTASQMLDEGLSKRLAAISSKDWQHEREYQLTKGKYESEADYHKRMAEIADKESGRKARQDIKEWGGIDPDTGKPVVGLRQVIAQIGANSKSYQTDSWSAVGELDGTPVWGNRSGPGLFKHMPTEKDPTRVVPLTPEESKKVMLSQKTTGEKLGPAIAPEALRAFSTQYWQSDPVAQTRMRLENPTLAAAAGVGGFKTTAPVKADPQVGLAPLREPTEADLPNGAEAEAGGRGGYVPPQARAYLDARQRREAEKLQLSGPK